MQPNVHLLPHFFRSADGLTGFGQGVGRTLGRLVVVGIIVGLLAPAARATVLRESEVEAAFVFNFTKFVDWPGATGVAPGRPLVIGVLREDAVSAAINAVIRGRQVNGRTLVVKSIRTAEDLALIDVLFVCAGEEGKFAELKPDLLGAPVLTVGESPAFAALDGMITLTVTNDQLRFAINPAAAQRARLKISAQLLKLATSVSR